MQPVVIQDSISIGAGTAPDNVIALNNSLRALSRLPFPARVTLAAVASANGLLIDLNIGSKNTVASSSPRTSASTPEIPFDVVNGDCYGEEGDTLALRAANPTGGGITLRYMIIAEDMTGQELPPDSRVIQQGPISVANGTVDQQLMDGLRYERAPADAIMSLLMTASAGSLFRQVYVSMERIAPPSQVSIANRVPQDPLDITVDGIQVPKDDLIQIAVTNNSGGALNAFFKVILKELSR